MKAIKKIGMLFLAIALVVSSLYVAQPTETFAASTYVIRVKGTNQYLYSGTRNWVMTKELNEADRSFFWLVTKKSDGTYWLLNKGTSKYLCLETQKDETGIAVVNANNYDEWQSGRWYLDLEGESTTIRNLWKGDSGYLYPGENDTYSRVYFGEEQGEFVLEEMNPAIEGYTEPNTTGGVADGVVIPEANENIGNIGATMPYTRYESQAAKLGGGATMKSSSDFARDNLASQASEQSYIEFAQAGAYAEWCMETTGDGVTMRFTLPDSEDGNGLNGSLDVYVNGVKDQTVNLSSYNMWQYFDGSALNDAPVDGATACFAFDEVHFKLNTKLKEGDKIRVQSTGANSLVYGVDFLEIEDVPAAIEKPENALSITDYGAVPNDGVNDQGAINRCVSAANIQGKTVYFPEGTFEYGSMWRLNASDIKITGAGMWYTNLMFTNPDQSSGGISGSTASNIEFCNMYINSALSSRYGENAVYKCFMDTWTKGCYIHDIWEDHFECGFWLANYGNATVYDDGIKLVNCRIRNNFADGVNFCRGTSNAVVYNCDIRNNGDDGLAMWNVSGTGVKDEFNNILCYNTIEFIWRAGGIAIYGGLGHQIYNNHIADTYLSSGIHLNTVFSGYKFTNNDNGITFSNNLIARSGSVADVFNNDFGAVDIMTGVRNITFNNTYIYDSQHDAVEISGGPTDIVFNNLNVYGTGYAGKTTNRRDTGAALKFATITTSQELTLNDFNYGNVKYANVVFGTRDSLTVTGEDNLGSDYTYEVPDGTSKIIREYRETPAQYTVTVDGEKVTTVIKGETFRIPEKTYGYYTDGKLYAPGAEYTVENDVDFSTVDISITDAASIKYVEPTGIRFKAFIDADENAFSDVISSEGILIAPESYCNETGTLDLTSSYTKVNVVNSGWYQNTTGLYSAGLNGIKKANYSRDFVARAYMTLKYEDGTIKTVYSSITGGKSVSGIAGAIKMSDSFNRLTESQQAIINNFIEK